MPVNPERIRKLGEFGLTEYQARAYLALLDLGTATASQIPPIARVPRTRIYATMQQLHERGLVEIIPETPLKYKPVPFSNYLMKLASEQRQRAETLEASIVQVEEDLAIDGGQAPGEAGRFEAVYGRRNARERLIKMYAGAKREAYGIGTTKSPGRIMKAFGSILQEKKKEGVALHYAFPMTGENWKDVGALEAVAEVRNIDFLMPVYMHVVDRREGLHSPPLPARAPLLRRGEIPAWAH